VSWLVRAILKCLFVLKIGSHQLVRPVLLHLLVFIWSLSCTLIFSCLYRHQERGVTRWWVLWLEKRSLLANLLCMLLSSRSLYDLCCWQWLIQLPLWCRIQRWETVWHFCGELQAILLGLVTDGAVLWFMYASVGGTVKLITSSCF